jgi:hypothetical protein
MYKYDIWNMYDGTEYFQNSLLKISILNHGMYLPWKIYNLWSKKINVEKF